MVDDVTQFVPPRLREGLRRVEDRHQKIIDLYSRGLSMREVAAHFGLTVEGVRYVLRRNRPDLIRPAFDTRSNSTKLASAQRVA